MTPSYLDSSLIADFNAKDPRAFQEVYNRFYKKLYFTCYKHIRDKEQAEDIAINMLNKIFQTSQEFESIKKLESYLFVGARNACFDFLDSIKRLNDNKQRYLSHLNDSALKTDIEHADYIFHVRECIELLPEKHKEIIQLIFFDELKYQEAADKLDVSPATVKRMRASAIEMLRRYLGGDLNAEALISALVIAIYLRL